jgi:hypothetical protein
VEVSRGAAGVIIPVALEQAARTMRGRDVIVLILIGRELDAVEYREVKQLWLGKRLGIARRTVGRSLARLVASGFLDAMEGPPMKYRLGPMVKNDRDQAA